MKVSLVVACETAVLAALCTYFSCAEYISLKDRSAIETCFSMCTDNNSIVHTGKLKVELLLYIVCRLSNSIQFQSFKFT